MDYGHPTEDQFHQLLARHSIEASYEPHLFAVGRLLRDTRVHEAFFRPDFYVPELDLYVELTTSRMASKNTRYKFLKAARLQFLHPHVRIVVLPEGPLRHLLTTPMKREGILRWLEREAANTERCIGIAQKRQAYQLGLMPAA